VTAIDRLLIIVTKLQKLQVRYGNKRHRNSKRKQPLACRATFKPELHCKRPQCLRRGQMNGNGKAMSMIQRISITGSMLLALGVGASGGGLPQFEVTGFPISPLQMSVLNSGRVQEESPNPELILHGMLVSPHQAAVLIGPLTARCVCSRDWNVMHVRWGPLVRD
jgi:hypothetical protein